MSHSYLSARRIVFVSDIQTSIVGAGRHAQRKIDLLSVEGEVDPYCGRNRLLPALRQLNRCDLVYGRMAPSTLPVLWLYARAGVAVVAELNGFVFDDFERSGPARAALLRMARDLTGRQNVIMCGDSAYAEYAKSLAANGLARWFSLPLGLDQGWSDGPEADPPTDFGPRIRPYAFFGGGFVSYQGIHELAELWARHWCLRGDLRVAGSGPPTELLNVAGRSGCVTLLPPLAGSSYRASLEGARVLVAPYRRDRFAKGGLSSLKTLDYCMTGRPVVTMELDTVLEDIRLAGDPEDYGVFSWNGIDLVDLDRALNVAWEFEVDPEAMALRAQILVERRGAAVQHERLSELVGLAAENSHLRRLVSFARHIR